MHDCFLLSFSHKWALIRPYLFVFQRNVFIKDVHSNFNKLVISNGKKMLLYKEQFQVHIENMVVRNI